MGTKNCEDDKSHMVVEDHKDFGRTDRSEM